MAGLDSAIGPIYAHGAVQNLTSQYRESGIELPKTIHVGSLPKGTKFGASMILAPPSALGQAWSRQFGPTSTGFASGWMRIRGTRRRKSVDRGFILSDHADWDGLNYAIKATGAERVIVTHGYAAELVRWLQDSGLEAETMRTEFAGELEEAKDAPEDEEVTDVSNSQSTSQLNSDFENSVTIIGDEI